MLSQPPCIMPVARLPYCRAIPMGPALAFPHPRDTCVLGHEDGSAAVIVHRPGRLAWQSTRSQAAWLRFTRPPAPAGDNARTGTADECLRVDPGSFRGPRGRSWAKTDDRPLHGGRLDPVAGRRKRSLRSRRGMTGSTGTQHVEMRSGRKEIRRTALRPAGTPSDGGRRRRRTGCGQLPRGRRTSGCPGRARPVRSSSGAA